MKDWSTTQRRASMRVQGYDYASRGGYFVTICARRHTCLFGEVVGAAMSLNELGQIVREEWFRTSEARAAVFLDANEFVVMPNHVHGIIWIMQDTPARATWRVAPAKLHSRPQGPRPGSLGALIGQFKSLTTKRINKHRGEPGAAVWQRGYYEHVIRRSAALDKIRRYILENPARWQFDSENPICVRQALTPDQTQSPDQYPW